MTDANPAPAPFTAPGLRAPGLRHGFFTRAGGVSTGPYASLNAGAGSDDDPAAVAENRARAARALGLPPERLLFVRQVHSARAVTVDGPWPGDPPEADAMVTATPGLALGVLAADCAPVLLHDPAARVIGAAHAGWRGAFDGVLEATVDAMRALGAEPARMVAAVGPCIGQASYEVGPEFMERFTDDDPQASRFFAGGPRGRPMFDLPGYALSRLRDAGVGSVEALGRCTYADPDRFFSHRRGVHEGAPDYGRLVSAIAMEPA